MPVSSSDPLTDLRKRGRPIEVADLGPSGILLVLQYALNQLDYELPVTGEMDDATSQAILETYDVAVKPEVSPEIQKHLDLLAQWVDQATNLPGVTVDEDELKDLTRAAEDLLN
jgi:cell division FtsZ-interacting protein ZapD